MEGVPETDSEKVHVQKDEVPARPRSRRPSSLLLPQASGNLFGPLVTSPHPVGEKDYCPIRDGGPLFLPVATPIVSWCLIASAALRTYFSEQQLCVQGQSNAGRKAIVSGRSRAQRGSCLHAGFSLNSHEGLLRDGVSISFRK